METKIFYDYIATSMLLSDEVLIEIEQWVKKYPWFTLAQQVLLENYYASKDSRYADYKTRTVLSAPSREHLYRRLHQYELMDVQTSAARSSQQEALLDVIDEKEQAVLEKEEEKNRQKIVITGSDYFASDEFTINTTLDDPIARFIIEKPKINPYTSPLLGISLEEPTVRIRPFESVDIVTETLAKVYEEQGVYNLALETYEKLILLDRKKSAYFADRIKKMKSKYKH